MYTRRSIKSMERKSFLVAAILFFKKKKLKKKENV